MEADAKKEEATLHTIKCLVYGIRSYNNELAKRHVAGKQHPDQLRRHGVGA
jgi:hypothetical protein